MERINTEQELSTYNLSNKWNDYIGVQKEIVSVLKREGYFENNDIINIETGMVVRITPKGIKETIGNGNRFQNLPKKVKQQKVATLRKLPSIIREGHLSEDDVRNYHSEDGEKFAYFICDILIDEVLHNVRIVVKKKMKSNHFYIHHIDTKKL